MIYRTHSIPPSIYLPDFIATQQDNQTNNVLPETIQEQMDQIHTDIKEFMSNNVLDKFLTARFLSVKEGVNDTCKYLPTSLYRVEPDINPSTIFAVTSILKGCTYINSSPQNTSISRVIEISRQ